ncbi:MAG TPA: hypothetical protein VFM38_12010, partial [Candidatus Limnocylindrales bacterium]|nr:hypothetical protein [Candidatus Limnocylindrales bacterium]
MRTLFALALLLSGCGACGSSDRGPSVAGDASSANALRGPDPIVVRIPRSGGEVRAFLYPKLDSVIWTSTTSAPAPARILAFDDNAGSIAFVDRSGLPERIDLRHGDVSRATKAKLAALASSDGWAIYGIDPEGAVTRLTPTGDWSYTPDTRARQLIPQVDGSLLILTDSSDGMALQRVHPPEATVIGSAAMPKTQRTLPVRVGDRVYFVVDSGLVGVRGRDLAPVPEIRFPRGLRAVAPTPSGDRIFALTGDGGDIAVVDRYRDAITSRITLPGVASDLRIDPLGRYLLARADGADSAWVIAVGPGHVAGSVATEWLTDLPFVGPDGSIALAQGKDVVFVDGETLRQRATITDGAEDFWYLFPWNGFRPRAAGLDQPVVFATADSDSVAAAALDSSALAPVARDSQPELRPAQPRQPATDTARREPSRRTGFTVSFAALLSEQPARQLADAID